MKNRIRFVWETIQKDITGTRYLHTVIFVLLAVGVSVPLWVGQMIWNLYRDSSLSEYEYADRLIVAEYKDVVHAGGAETRKQMLASEAEENLTALVSEGIDHVGFSAFAGAVISWEEESVWDNVQGYSEHFWLMNGYEVTSGCGPEEAWNKERIPCYLKEGSILYDKGIEVGEILSVAGQEMEVAGIIRAPKMYGVLAVPYGAWAFLMDGTQVQFQTLFRFVREADIQSVRSALADKSIIQISQGKEQEAVYLDSVQRLARERLLTGIMMQVFSMISLTAVMNGMMAQEKYRIAVRMALGAKMGTVFGENILRMEILLFFSFITDVLLYPSLFGKLHGMSRYLDGMVILFVWFLYGCLLFLLYAVLWQKVFGRDRLSSILKEIV